MKKKRTVAAQAAARGPLPDLPKELLDELVKGPMTPNEVQDLMLAFNKAIIERAMGAEMNMHLGYRPGEAKPPEQANERNGASGKTIITDRGPVRVDLPRDRDGSFEPILIPKHERRFTGFDERIIAMYARGMSVREIQGFLAESYGTEVSPDFISSVTDEVMAEAIAWQSRPLEAMYPVVFFDALRVKIRSDGVVQRWADTPRWQFFSGQSYYEDRQPCDATTLVKFRKLLGEDGVEELLAQTINVAVELKLIKPQELSRVIVDSTGQEKAIAHPTDSRLLETARIKLVEAAKGAGIALKQTFAKEGEQLSCQAGRFAHARQFKRMRRAIKRQRTIVGRLAREIDRKASAIGQAVREALDEVLGKAQRIGAQSAQRKAIDGQPKLYAWHAPEVSVPMTRTSPVSSQRCMPQAAPVSMPRKSPARDVTGPSWPGCSITFALVTL